jgi:uncharacterized membrane protein
METLVGYILLGGVLLSVALIVIGTAWHWGTAGRLGLDYPLAGGNLFQFILGDARQAASGVFRPRLLVSTGIIALMLTPYVRVAASMVYFAAAEHNWKYTLFTLFVFTVLTFSLLLR